ncbi:MAG: ABC transporter substrate binding protein [Thermodesulfobacteriota bacterium]
MAGRKSLISWLAALLLLGTCLAGSGWAAGPVVVLLSDDDQAYGAPLAAFNSELALPVQVFQLGGDVQRAPAVMGQILAARPALIFALGAKAAYVAKTWTADYPEIPVLFAMVLNWERYQLAEGQANVTGVALETGPGSLFAYLAMICPQAQRIGVVYSQEHSGQMVAEARVQAALLGLELVAEPLSRPQDLQPVVRGMEGRIDAFWIIPDPVLYTLDNIGWLTKRCVRDRLPCLGPSRSIASVGLLAAVDPDHTAIGHQAAAMARRLLAGEPARELGVEPPLGTRLILNTRTAGRIGLTLNREALGLSSEIIDGAGE